MAMVKPPVQPETALMESAAGASSSSAALEVVAVESTVEAKAKGKGKAKAKPTPKAKPKATAKAKAKGEAKTKAKGEAKPNTEQSFLQRHLCTRCKRNLRASDQDACDECTKLPPRTNPPAASASSNQPRGYICIGCVGPVQEFGTRCGNCADKLCAPTGPSESDKSLETGAAPHCKRRKMGTEHGSDSKRGDPESSEHSESSENSDSSESSDSSEHSGSDDDSEPATGLVAA
jgi:hypothetical protein